MGFESFRVELRGGVATSHQVDTIVSQLPHAIRDHDSIPTRGSTYYTIEDGAHRIEVEVSESPVRISCRFTLCHPASVDSVFLGLIHELMNRLGMSARICDDESARNFAPDEFSDFAAILLGVISTRRGEWIANFGLEQFPASTVEVYQKIILPKCVSMVQ